MAKERKMNIHRIRKRQNKMAIERELEGKRKEKLKLKEKR
jgi:hypothetical protein